MKVHIVVFLFSAWVLNLCVLVFCFALVCDFACCVYIWYLFGCMLCLSFCGFWIACVCMLAVVWSCFGFNWLVLIWFVAWVLCCLIVCVYGLFNACFDVRLFIASLRIGFCWFCCNIVMFLIWYWFGVVLLSYVGGL